MKDIVKNQLIKDGWQQGDKLLLAVSGGVDSMVLWQVVHDLKIDYAIAHVNFQLRGKESDSDQSLIEKIAKHRKSELFVLQQDTAKYAKENGVSIQMAAREIRYDWFHKLMEENQINFLCTAHHLNDSIETFFINLDRGTGIKGLGGISSTAKILRPLISTTKQEISNYAETHEVDFREDQSNQETKYKRNWFRKTILSDWKEQNPSFEKTMAKNLDRFARAEQVYQKALNTDLKKLRTELNNHWFYIASAKQLEFPEESLFELLSEYGFSETQINNLHTGILNNQVGLLLHTEKFELNLDREKVYLRARKEATENEGILIFKYQNEIQKPISLSFDLLTNNEISFKENSKIEHIDFDKLSFPIKVRKWKNGDKMKPLGMNGQKKISDILVDYKVPLIEKEACWVLESKQKVVWLVGYKVSDEFKVDAKTQQVLKMQLND